MQKGPPWKKRLEKQMKELRANLSKLQEWQKSSLKNKKEKDRLNRIYSQSERTECCRGRRQWQGISGMKPDINSGDRISCQK